MPPTRRDQASAHERHGYFVVQATARNASGEIETSGVVENLTTGEKLPFTSPTDVARMLRDWAQEGETGTTGSKETDI
jgi:hypothetical protein